MSAPVEFTGERFLPECTGEIWAEHWHRYLFAASFVAGKDVLDAACGEGYGSAWLARHAKSVVGLDIDVATVAGARAKYTAQNLKFEAGSVCAMPFPDASFDCAVSFETLEHLAEQEEMLAELRRILRPDGILIISTPNRVEYSERRAFHNAFHVRELDEHEFHALIARHFSAQRWFGQKLLFNSAVWPLPETAGDRPDWVSVDESARRMPAAMYFVAIAAAASRHIPDAAPVTLLADPEEAMYRDYEQTVARVGTLEQLSRRQDRLLGAREEHIRHLETLAIDREHIVEERDRQLEAQSARAAAMEKLIALRDETIIGKDRLLAATNERTAALERLVSDRERLVVKRDAELAAVNARIDKAESLVAKRDGELVAVNARAAEAERLVVERDGQLVAVNERAATLERLVAERERIIVERDRLLEATNQRAATLEQLVAERERIIVERDTQLAAAMERMSEIERVIAARDQQVLDQQGRLAVAASDIAALERDKLGLQGEVARRGRWRWLLALPYLRLRRLLAPAGPAPRQGES